MTRVRRVFVLVLVVLLTSPCVASADPTLGMDDAGALVTKPLDPDAVLTAGTQHGVQILRMIDYMGRYPNGDRYYAAARLGVEHGLRLDIVLALRPLSQSGPVTPTEFAAWAAERAALYAGLDPHARISLLNEPDLLMAASDDCDPTNQAAIVRSAGMSISQTEVTSVAKVPGVTRVRATIRLHKFVHRRSRHRPYRILRVRRAYTHTYYTMVPVAKTVQTTKVVETTAPNSIDDSSGATTVTVARGCLAIMRARKTALYLKAAIPAVRAAAPSVEVGAGETSPCVGVEAFLRALAQAGIPPVDRWTHHPYAKVVDGNVVDSPSGSFYLDRTEDYAALVRKLFDVRTIDLTEFGVQKADGPLTGASVWRYAYRQACAIGARSIVAYQWTPTPPGGGAWDTSLMNDGLTDTPASAQLPNLRCSV